MVSGVLLVIAVDLQSRKLVRQSHATGSSAVSAMDSQNSMPYYDFRPNRPFSRCNEPENQEDLKDWDIIASSRILVEARQLNRFSKCLIGLPWEEGGWPGRNAVLRL